MTRPSSRKFVTCADNLNRDLYDYQRYILSFAMDSPPESPADVIFGLRTLRVAIFDIPDDDTTVGIWKAIEEDLPLEYREDVLLIWNKSLCGMASRGEVRAVLNRIIKKCREG